MTNVSCKINYSGSKYDQFQLMNWIAEIGIASDEDFNEYLNSFLDTYFKGYDPQQPIKKINGSVKTFVSQFEQFLQESIDENSKDDTIINNLNNLRKNIFGRFPQLDNTISISSVINEQIIEAKDQAELRKYNINNFEEHCRDLYKGSYGAIDILEQE